MNKGQSHGYRVIAVYIPELDVLAPFCLYTHNEYAGQPRGESLRQWIKDVMDRLPGLAE